MADHVAFRPAVPEDAAAMTALAARAFASRPVLDPPSPAVDEPVAQVAAELAEHGGVVGVDDDGGLVAALRLLREPPAVWLRRVAVDPHHHGGGLGTRLVLWTQAWLAGGAVPGTREVRADVRVELPANHVFWDRLGYAPVEAGRPPHLRSYARALPPAVRVPDAAAMRRLGTAIADLLQPGDLVLLHGELGAGKTTLTQGIGRRLGVRGAVTSPTFVVAREHPGPLPLVHVDAYRLGGRLELDDLDLDVARAVTVVEWGEGLAERLAPDRLEVRLVRGLAGDDDGDLRVAVLEAFGERWRGVALPSRA